MIASTIDEDGPTDGSRPCHWPGACLGLRDYAQQQFGLLAMTVLNSWNIRRTDDFGKIVFAMIGGLLRKTEQDSIADFQTFRSLAPRTNSADSRSRVPVNSNPDTAIGGRAILWPMSEPDHGSESRQDTLRDLANRHIWQIQPIRDLLVIVAVLLLLWLGAALRRHRAAASGDADRPTSSSRLSSATKLSWVSRQGPPPG